MVLPLPCCANHAGQTAVCGARCSQRWGWPPTLVPLVQAVLPAGSPVRRLYEERKQDGTVWVTMKRSEGPPAARGRRQRGGAASEGLAAARGRAARAARPTTPCRAARADAQAAAVDADPLLLGWSPARLLLELAHPPLPPTPTPHPIPTPHTHTLSACAANLKPRKGKKDYSGFEYHCLVSRATLSLSEPPACPPGQPPTSRL